MKLNISRETLLNPLQMVSGAVERRQTLPILGNVLISTKQQQLSVTATDLEVELVGRVQLSNNSEENDITVPGRKLLDIVRALPEGSDLEILQQEGRLLLKSGKSRFTLTTLPASEFPNVENVTTSIEFSLPQKTLKDLIEKTHFAMAHQDVRYYLNGLLFHAVAGELKLVATDGHRLAFAKAQSEAISSDIKVIVPRKGVLELMRLLNDSDDLVQLNFSDNHIQAITPGFTFTSKLVEGKFPDYERVIPKVNSKIAVVGVDEFKQNLSRAAILSNQKYRGIRLNFMPGALQIFANNPDQEQAEEEIAIQYDDATVELGFNVNYLLDIVSSVPAGSELKISLKDASSGILIEPSASENALYVVMPMRL